LQDLKRKDGRNLRYPRRAAARRTLAQDGNMIAIGRGAPAGNAGVRCSKLSCYLP